MMGGFVKDEDLTYRTPGVTVCMLQVEYGIRRHFASTPHALNDINQ